MTVPANRLFAAAPLESLFLAIESRIQKTIEAIETSLVTNSNLEDIAKTLEAQYKLNLPILNRNDVHISGTDDCKVDVRNDHNRNVSDRSKPCLVAGKRVTVSVPFTGDAKLLMQNPKAPNAILTSATVEKDKIELIYTRPLPLDNQLLERDIQNDINAVEANLTFINSEIMTFNRNLFSSILNKLSSRKSAIEAGKDALHDISLPIRLTEKPVQQNSYIHPVQQPLAQKAIKTKSIPTGNTAYQYDVFICHASEDKETVATPLANELTERGINVWYDQFALKIGDSLMQKIDEGLKQSKYGIVILSPHFFEKNWPKRELVGLTQKEMKDGTKVILPIWHNVTRDDVYNFSMPLADKMAGNTSDMAKLIKDILDVVREALTPQADPMLKQLGVTKKQPSAANPQSKIEPKLAVTFLDGTTVNNVSLEAPPEAVDAYLVERKVSALKEKHPYININNVFRPFPDDQRIANLYNEGLNEYFKEWENWLPKWLQFKQIKARSLVVYLKISNDGNCPATDVTVQVTFPAGLSISSTVPEEPPHPIAPLHPKQHNFANGSDSYSANISFAPPSHPAQRQAKYNQVELQKQTVEFSLSKLQQKRSEALYPIHGTFDDYLQASSFSLDCTLMSDEMPEPIEIKLELKIHKSSSSVGWPLTPGLDD